MRALSLFAIAILLSVPVLPARAGECYEEPYHEAVGTLTVNSGVFMRSGPCTTGTSVLATAPAGAQATVLADDDGWYLYRLGNGATGWSYQTFLTVGTLQLTTSNRAAIEAKFPVSGPTGSSPAPAPAPAPTTGSSAPTRLNGYILLQVQQHGEAWYVNPTDGARYYMKDGPTAYEMMRSFGLGMTEGDYEKLAAGDATLKARLKGRIVLRVQLHGEAYYLHPDGSVYYLKDGPAAYEVMRAHSLGITDADLARIASKTLILKPTTPVSSGDFSAIHLSAFQGGSIPSNIDVLELNRYWLGKVNALRAAKNLRLLVLDQRFVDTASEWAAWMGENDTLTHTRPDGKTMHQWIDTKGLAFTVRNSLPDGWVTNYFTENISWDFAGNSMADAKMALDNTLAFYLAEGPDGAHYRTIYHPDWNTIGVGFYFRPADNRYKTFMAFHYGSLQR